MPDSQTPRPQTVWEGTPVSSGVAHAVAHVLKDHFDEPEIEQIAAEEVESELGRLKKAIAITRQELEDTYPALEKRAEEEGADHSDIFDTHLLILEDASILAQVEKTVREKLIGVDAVYYNLMRKHIEALRGLSDAYLRERFLDIKDVTHRVMRHLRGELRTELSFEHPVIIVAHDLTPSDTVQMDRSKVLGFAIETGSALSHAAIIAKSLGLPAVVRIHGLSESVHSGDPVLLDGDQGLLVLNPSQETIDKYRQREEIAERKEDLLQETRHEPAVTLDGRAIRVGANGEFIEELDVIQDCGAEEVGLFRTEFLYLENPNASEDALTDAYVQVVETLSPKLVIFRTLDLGGDKVDPVLAQEPEPNPFLGWRGIRVSLRRKEFFKRQLRALLRASAFGRVGIMFPMISGVAEVREAKAMLLECSDELREEGLSIPSEIEVGAMIEVPSAAVTADLIAQEVDFLSLGTNDLIQYTIAVDRVNERVTDLYSPTHLAILRLITQVVNAGRKSGVRVGICGEMAADVTLTPLLVGMGLDELSVAASQVARVKHAVRRLNADECRRLVEQALEMTDPAEILDLSRALACERYRELFA